LNKCWSTCWITRSNIRARRHSDRQRVDPPDRFALVQVRDEGVGIPSDDLPRIGQRFYRADKARARAQGGHGLGLAIAQSLVHAHGGELCLDSQEGNGTVASFTLPPPALALIGHLPWHRPGPHFPMSAGLFLCRLCLANYLHFIAELSHAPVM